MELNYEQSGLEILRLGALAIFMLQRIHYWFYAPLFRVTQFGRVSFFAVTDGSNRSAEAQDYCRN